MDNFKYDVFISYSRKDTDVVDKICKCFDNNNITYFIDKQGIGGGLEFPKVLAEAILDSKVFLFVASSNSYKSKFTQSEVVFAFNRKQKSDIIPYIIDNSSFPPELELTFSAINWRRRETHPIDTTLVNDILKRLQRDPVPDSGYISFWDKNIKKIIIGLIVVVMLTSLLIGNFISIMKTNLPENEEVDTINKNVVQEVNDSLCKNIFLGNYQYTGPIDDNKLPNGKGTAVFENGDLYEGKFIHGKFEGHATYLFAIGDKFVGTFKDNSLYQGTYTRGNGKYFRGYFKNGQPDLSTGKWFDAHGVEINN